MFEANLQLGDWQVMLLHYNLLNDRKRKQQVCLYIPMHGIARKLNLREHLLMEIRLCYGQMLRRSSLLLNAIVNIMDEILK